jgi:hypothetical protein
MTADVKLKIIDNTKVCGMDTNVPYKVKLLP